jgi:hypothetical protein
MIQIEVESNLAKKWQRTAFIADNGHVFLPCGLFGNESMMLPVLLTCSARQVRFRKHVYAPAAWLEKEYPEHAQSIRTIAEKVRRAAAAKG